MKERMHEVNKEYIIVEKLLDKVYNSMFTIQKDADLIKHEIEELSIALENLGLSLHELSNLIWLKGL